MYVEQADRWFIQDPSNCGSNDPIAYHVGKSFYTPDRDNSNNCAEEKTG